MTDDLLSLAVECRRTVGRHLKARYATTSLNKDQLAAAYPTRAFTSGWRLSDVAAGDKRYTLDVCLPSGYPFSAPRLALLDGPEFLSWPHVERDGVLCLLAEQATIDPLQPVPVLEELTASALKLIAESDARANEEDFREEFLTYWSYGVEDSNPKFRSLLGDSTQNRFASCLCTRSTTFVAESDDQLASWLGKLRSKKTPPKIFNRGLLVACSKALLPSEYPQDAAALLRLVTENGAQSKLIALSAADPPSIPVVLQMPASTSKCLAGVTLVQPSRKDSFGRVVQAVGRGFRPGRTPPALAARQYLSGARMLRSNVERMDHDWIHGRDTDRSQQVLKNATVLVVGCGSVGGFVAQQLAMAGVGNLCLVDPQRLAAGNIGRHFLGMPSLGRSKAVETAKVLQANYPHLSIVGHSMDWQTYRHESQSDWSKFQLVLSLTGDWQSESLLNAEHLRSREERKVLYGWTEPHACAGHAVLVSSRGGCFACQTDNLGKALRTLSHWSTGTHQTEPACGAVFQPYGPVELSGTVNLISSLALESLLRPSDVSIHNMWIGSTQILNENGGNWDHEWFEELDISGRENLRVSCPWQPNEQCLYCGGDSNVQD